MFSKHGLKNQFYVFVPPTPEFIWKFFGKIVLPKKQPFNFVVKFQKSSQIWAILFPEVFKGAWRREAPPVLFAQPWHERYFAPTHHQFSLSVCLDPLPTLQSNEPVPQVVNLSCFTLLVACCKEKSVLTLRIKQPWIRPKYGILCWE